MYYNNEIKRVKKIIKCLKCVSGTMVTVFVCYVRGQGSDTHGTHPVGGMVNHADKVWLI